MDHPPKNRTIIIISLLTIIVGTIVILGWLFGVQVFQSIVPGFEPMRFNTALCFILLGSALLLTQYQTRKYNTLLFIILSLLGTLIGLITLCENIFHFNSGLDQLFVTDTVLLSRRYPYPGRMASNAAASFLLMGLGFLIFATKRRLFQVLSQFFFHIVTILSAIALIGYLYGVSLFYTLFYVSSMATHTAILFFILSVAASLLNPSIGITRLFTGKRVGNQMAKRLFTLILLMVIIFGSFKVQTQRFQVLTLDLGISLLAVCFLLVSLLLIWNTANWLNRIDVQRSEAEAEVKLMNAELEKRVEERSAEIQKSEEKYRSLIEQASDAICVIDFKRNFTEVNASMCKMIGYTRDELLRLNAEAIVDPEELERDPLQQNMKLPGQSVIRERRFMRKDGTVFPVEINAKMFSDDRILVIVRDITSRKKMERELREAELKFRTIAEKSMVGVYIVQNNTFVYVNPRFANVFGYEAQELIGAPNPINMIFHESYHAIVAENVRLRISGELESLHYEAMGRKKDGTINWVEIYGNRVIIGEEPAIIGSMIDITERKQAEELILREKMLSDTIINSLPGIFYLHNKQYKFLRWNKNFETVIGYTSEEIEKISVSDVIAQEDREIVEKAIQKTFTDGYVMVEAKAITKNGVKIPFLFTGTPVMYENQLCLLGTGIDISLRIKAEEELRSSELKYKLLFESNPLPLWMIAKDDLSIIAVNEAAANLYGYTRDELLKMSVTALRPKEDFEQQLERYRKDAGDSTDFGIIRHLKKDGSIMFVQLIAHDIIFEGKSVRLSLTNDVTEKLKGEKSLQKSEANLQTILKTTDTAYALFDKDLKVLSFNQKAIAFVKEQFGHFPEKGDSLADYFPEERFPQFKQFALDVLNGNNINYEVDYPKQSGGVRWYYVRLFPITNDNKEILGLMMALYDITERKNAEQDLKNAYERIQSHINSIKEIAWKQSHLVRSPLANLKALSAMLKDDPSDAEVLEHFQFELNRLDDIIIEMADEASGQDV